MGWPKCAEDNYDAFYERQAMKGGDIATLPAYPTAKISIKDISSFCISSDGKSCLPF